MELAKRKRRLHGTNLERDARNLLLALPQHRLVLIPLAQNDNVVLPELADRNLKPLLLLGPRLARPAELLGSVGQLGRQLLEETRGELPRSANLAVESLEGSRLHTSSRVSDDCLSISVDLSFESSPVLRERRSSMSLASDSASFSDSTSDLTSCRAIERVSHHSWSTFCGRRAGQERGTNLIALLD